MVMACDRADSADDVATADAAMPPAKPEENRRIGWNRISPS
jgi:hypothetical protein